MHHLRAASLSLALLPALPAVAHAGGWRDDPAFSTPPSALLAALAEARQEDPEASDRDGVVVLLEEEGVRFDGSGRTTHVYRRIFGVTDDKALEPWGTLEAGWAPWYQDRPTLRARIVSADGTVRESTGEGLPDTAAHTGEQHTLTDSRVLRLPLPGLGVGAVVEQRIEVPGREPFLAAGDAARVPLRAWWPVERMHVWVEAPSTMPLAFAVGEGAPAARRTQRGGVQVVEVRLDDTPPLERTSYIPPDQAGWPWLSYSTLRSWEEVSRAYHARVSGKLDAAGLDALVARVRQAGPDPAAQVDVAFRIARDEVRYTGVHFGDQAIVPATPAETIQRGFGDCKDKATLLVALLASVGIPAELALTRTGDATDVDPTRPGASVFDHAIVHVVSLDRWLDPTSPDYPVTVLPPWHSGRHALPIRPQGAALVRLPTSRVEDHTHTERRVLHVEHDGKSVVEESFRASGWPAQQLRSSFLAGTEAELLERVRAYGEQTYETGEVRDLRRAGLEIQDAAVEAAYTFDHSMMAGGGSVSASVFTRGGGAFGQVPPMLLQDPEPDQEDPLASRSAPMWLWPFRTELTIEVDLLDVYELREPLPDLEEQHGIVTLRRTMTTPEDGPVELTWTVESQGGALTVDQARALRASLDEADRVQEVVWDHRGSVLMGEGRRAEAMAAYADAVRERPDDPHVRNWWVEALLNASLVDAARMVAEQATRDLPQSPDTWATLGYSRMYGQWGDPRGPTMDVEGALSAYDQALRLDPDHARSLSSAALVRISDWEHQPVPQRPDLTRTVELLDRYRARHGGDLDNLALLALFDLGRYDELLALARAHGGLSTFGLSQWLATVVLQQGAPAARRLLADWRLSDSDEQDVIKQAYDSLTERRHYGATADLLDLFAAHSANPMGIRDEQELLRSLRPWPEVIEKIPEPERTARVFFLATLEGDADRLEAVIGPQIQRVLEEEGGVDAYARASLDVSAAKGLTAPYFADAVAANLEARVHGRGREPSRVDLGEEGALVKVSLDWTRAGWHLIDLGTRQGLSLEALGLLLQGDLEGAQRRYALAQDDPQAVESVGRMELVRFALDASQSADPAQVSELAATELPGATDPDDRRKLLIVGLATLLQQERLEEAQALLSRERARGPLDPVAADVGLVVDALNPDNARAQDDLRARLANGEPVPPFLAPLCVQLGLVAEGRSIWEQRRRDGQLAMEDRTAYAEDLLMEPADPALAITLATELPLAERSADLLLLVALAHLAQGSPLEAERTLASARAAQGGTGRLSARWHAVVGGLAEAWGLPEAATSSWRKAVEATPEVPRTLGAYARARLAALEGAP